MGQTQAVTLDATDRKILFALDRDARQSIQELAKTIGSSKEATRYRVLRLEKRGILSGYHTYIDYKRLGYHAYCVYCRFAVVGEERKSAVLEFLKAHDRVYWISQYGGRFDLAFSVFAKSPTEFDAIYTDIIARCADALTHSEFILKLDARKYARTYLGYRPATKNNPRPPADQYVLSLVEQATLIELCKNSRTTATDIARTYATPLSTVLAAIKRLEGEKIIRGHTIVVQPDKIGMLSYQVNLRTRSPTQAQFESLFEYCAQHDGIVIAVKTIGAWNLELIYEVPDAKTMQRLLIELRTRFAPLIEEAELVTIFEDYLKLNHYPFVLPSKKTLV